MCVRCGTGRIAWCTDPDRHGDLRAMPDGRGEEQARRYGGCGEMAPELRAVRLPASDRQAPPRERPGWDDYFLGVAQAVSRRAECVRRKVGAVIVRDRYIIACGYNGVPAGEPSCLLGACPGRSGVISCTAIHAEANALGHADVLALHGATMYVTDEPCLRCYRFAGRMGIYEIVFPIGPPVLPERREKPEWRACRRAN